jgi:peptide/nickel transport system substrate-binding protein
VDSRRVRFVNRAPDVTIEGRLTRSSGAIFSARGFSEAANWLDWARKPIGTGPYRVESLRADQELVLVAHDAYWGGRPAVARLRFIEVPDVAARVNALLAGDADFACDMPPDQIAGIERNPRFHVLGGRIANIRLVLWDKHHPVLANPLVRRAITHSMDRQAVVDALWAGRTVVPRGLQFEFFGPMLIEDWQPPKYDPAEARRLLREANYRGEPIPYQLLNNYYTNQVAGAQVMVENWRAAGLNVQIEMKENFSQLLGRVPNRGIIDNSNTAWFDDPSALAAAYIPGGQTWESGQYRNEEAPVVAQVLQNATDMDQRRRAWRRLLEIFEREDPCYSVQFQNATFTAKRRDIPWRVAQSWFMDFSQRGFGAA